MDRGAFMTSSELSHVTRQEARYELTQFERVYGEPRRRPPASVRQRHAVGAFHLQLARFVHEHSLGCLLLSPVDVVLDAERDLVLQPDLMFIASPRTSIIRERVLGAPDLVVDVVAGRPCLGEIQERLDWYFAYGVREAWVHYQLDQRLDVLQGGRDGIAARRSFDYCSPIASGLWPAWTLTPGQIVYA